MELPQVLLPDSSDSEILRLLEKYPLSSSDDRQFTYGTAGFRYLADLLPPIMVRVGICATLRSMEKQAAVGVVITASHNDESYNGLKIADPNGGMMESDGEIMAVNIVNQRDVSSLWAWCQERRQQLLTIASNSINASSSSFLPSPTLHVGRDTRGHSPALSSLVVKAARAMGCCVIDHGVVTTPMLHHFVLHHNLEYLPMIIPPRPNLMGYMDLVVHSYIALVETAKPLRDTSDSLTFGQLPLLVDCACGVGYNHVRNIDEVIRKMGKGLRHFKVANGPGSGPLNESCGSEHVQKTVSSPKFYDEESSEWTKSYCVSLDGDADRIVFFYHGPDVKFHLLDGDKIACLISSFLREEIDAVLQSMSTPPSLSLGVVQTAYANGASTKFLEQSIGGSCIRFAKTGVKYVHHAAGEFDVGVYFEANGHGTVLFGTKFFQFLSDADIQLRGARGRASTALQRLRILPALINQAVGDAISDLLLIDALLLLKAWTIGEWDAIYVDLPSRQCTVKVADRSKIQTSDDETTCLHPAEVQAQLNEAMRTMGGRTFIRPSGTEDVVRIYAEAATQQSADELASRAAQIVHALCDGVEAPPVFPPSRI